VSQKENNPGLGGVDPQLPSLTEAIKITVHGVVQGVGFRPFVHHLANRFGLTGWVRNTGLGVEIHLEGQSGAAFSGFIQALQREKPPLACLEEIFIHPDKKEGYKEFLILESQGEEAFVFISPDVATCEACFEEIMDPQERRFQYPFTNCTNCGPRYTIVEGLPYDRERTTMASFKMCAACAREYNDPMDRRHHAQPIACPDCGPQVQLLSAATGQPISGGLNKAAGLIKEGFIVAVKGLGGFHLMVDARNQAAIDRLRRVKTRQFKPLALMARDLEIIEDLAWVSKAEKEMLLAPSRPIVLLKKKKEIPGIAPHLGEMGFMLPYTPLHHLLLQSIDLVVATSSNRKDAPICKDEKEGLAELCDFILTHNRPIAMRADDSVLKVVANQPLFLRRARGFVPYPERIKTALPVDRHILGVGGELKVTISAYKRGTVVTSQFLGDLDEYQNYLYFEEALDHFTRLFHFKPQIIVSDLHPNFRTTRFAQRSGLPHLKVQHHYAHVLAAFLEHGLSASTKVLGISFDGYGHGLDGAAWGGEFLLADGLSFERLAHFSYVPLPGGDLAARQPWRMAIAHLLTITEARPDLLASLVGVEERKVEIVLQAIKRGFNSPPTSSCGRLFDAVACLLNLAPQEQEFEAEAAMRLEATANAVSEKPYPFLIEDQFLPWKITLAPLIEATLEQKRDGVPIATIASRFHSTLVQIILNIAKRCRRQFGVDKVVLSGGVFLNRWLTLAATEALESLGFKVWRPTRYSPNDESLSLGQIYHALAQVAAGQSP